MHKNNPTIFGSASLTGASRPDTEGLGLSNAAEAALYLQHLSEKMSRFQSILSETGYSELVIGAGEIKLRFQDNMAYPFKANPYFKEWVPLKQRPGSFLQITAGVRKPRLFLLCAEDIWHTAPQALPAGFDHGLDIVEYTSLSEIEGEVALDRAGGYIGETNSFKIPTECWNPSTLLNHIDFQRRSKTAYEQHCVREANRLAVPAHRAAYSEFMSGASELDISAAYLRACHCSENDMPYPITAGINENAAVLHHYRLDPQAPKTPRSLLLDAGVDYHGYASDITRTYAYDPSSEFAEMIQMLDQQQQKLVGEGTIGKDPVDLHVQLTQFLKGFAFKSDPDLNGKPLVFSGC